MKSNFKLILKLFFVLGLSMFLYYMFGTTFLFEVAAVEHLSTENPVEQNDTDNGSSESSIDKELASNVEQNNDSDKGMASNVVVKWFVDNSGVIISVTIVAILCSLFLYYYYPFGADLPTQPYEFNRITAPPSLSPAEVEALIQNLPKGQFFGDIRGLCNFSESAYLRFPDQFFSTVSHQNILVGGPNNTYYGVYFFSNTTNFATTAHLPVLQEVLSNEVFGYHLLPNQCLMFTNVALVDPTTLYYALYQRIDVVTIIVDGIAASHTVTDSLFQKYLTTPV